MSVLTDAAGVWVTSSASSGDGNCVEAAVTPTGVLVRDSKNRTGPTLDFGAQEWLAFVTGAKAGEFDLS